MAVWAPATAPSAAAPASQHQLTSTGGLWVDHQGVGPIYWLGKATFGPGCVSFQLHAGKVLSPAGFSIVQLPLQAAGTVDDGILRQ